MEILEELDIALPGEFLYVKNIKYTYIKPGEKLKLEKEKLVEFLEGIKSSI